MDVPLRLVAANPLREGRGCVNQQTSSRRRAIVGNRTTRSNSFRSGTESNTAQIGATMTRPALRWQAWLLTAVFVAAVFGVIVAKRIWVYRNIHEPLQARAALISAELRAKGARVGEPEVLDDVRGAEQVVSLDIDGRKVRLLELDPSK